MNKSARPVIFSGMQPTGTLTLGNYLGAMRNWVRLQDDYDCLYCVVDMHAITVRNDPRELRRKSLSVAAVYMAAGIDPGKSLIYLQSHVPEHAQLSWALSCHTYMGELSRMTQFKEKSQKNEDNINAGLFTYPVLMAADILLFQAALVPVGDDQKQHLELARDIAIRVNNAYGPTFTVPEPYIPPVGARIMSLQNPLAKMSKSDEDETSYIAILDGPDTIRKKMKRAVTDSDGRVAASPDKPGVTNLMTILSAVTGEGMNAMEERFAGKGYGALKAETAEAVVSLLSPIQARYAELMKDEGELLRILRASAQEASRRARPTLAAVFEKVGFVL